MPNDDGSDDCDYPRGVNVPTSLEDDISKTYLRYVNFLRFNSMKLGHSIAYGYSVSFCVVQTCLLAK